MRPLARRLPPLALCAALAAAGACSSTEEPKPAAEAEPRQFDEAAAWPHRFEGEEGVLELYQPQVTSWEAHATLKGRAAIALTPKGEQQPVLGALTFQALTTTDFEERTVVFHHQAVLDTRFPTASDVGMQVEYRRAVEALLPRQPLEIELDYLLALASGAQGAKQSVKVNLEPPPIFVSREKAILVQFLGKPAFRPVERVEGLEVALNTNWDVLRETASGRVHVRVERGWLATADLERGPWEPVTTLPASFTRLPTTDDWSEVQAAIPGTPLSAPPKVYVALEPSELLVVRGREAGEPIAGTELFVITNAEGDADLFFHSKLGFYWLVAGRWFSAKALEGPWTSAQAALPPDFARIPRDHPKARVRASVPGTPEAEEAVLQASIPRQATVKRKETTVQVVYGGGEPQWVEIEGTGVAFAQNTTSDVFRHEGRYYVCHQGVWFVGETPTGPFAVCDSVPAAIYAIPSTSPKYHVTYVRVYDSTPEYVVTGYTSGYCGMYVSAGVVMWGTAWAWYYPYDCWHYYSYYPWAYGSAAWYDPYHGVYRATSTVYGPYGGVTRGAVYNPTTGTYARGVSAWGPNGGAFAARAYNPYTGTSAATRQASTAYADWGQSVVRHGNDWARTAHYSDSRGTAAGFRTSGGAAGVGYRGDQGSGGAVRTGSGDLYVGKDGEVYRRTEDGWEHHGSDGWQSVDRDQARAEARERAEAKGYDGSRASEARERAEAKGLDGSRASEARSSWASSRDDLQRNAEARDRGSWSSSRSSSYRGGGGRSSGGGGGRGGGGRGGGRR